MFKNASHHLNLKQVVIFLLVEDIALMLMVVNQSGWWLLNTDIAVVLKTTLKFAASIFTISLQHAMLLASILTTIEISKLESVLPSSFISSAVYIIL